MPSPYEWSNDMDRIFGDLVVRIVQDDPRTDWGENLSLGYPFDVIREEVLAKGLADFTIGHAHVQHGNLSAAEKCLLYAFVNMKKHFFACTATLEAFQPAVEALFAQEQRVVVVDVGCGPATACIALADLLPGRTFDYIGIEASLPMQATAQRFWEAARAVRLLGPNSTAGFFASWNDVDATQIDPPAPVLVVFSYFFASKSLDLPAIESLARFVQSLIASRTEQDLLMLYLNSTVVLANRNYELFKWQLGARPARAPSTEVTIEYRKRRGAAVAGQETFVREVLTWKHP
jgi:hypothetical protein